MLDKNEGEIKPVGLEVGSLIVPPPYRKNGLSQVVIPLLVEEMKEKFPGVPIFAVVAEGNIPSLKTFRKLGCRKENITNQTEYFIGSGNEKVNILEGWPYPSFLFWF
jgi:RimJ/RimL family protein N-acetyltransferase